MKKKIVLIVCTLSLLIAILPHLASQLTAEEGKEIFREPIYIRPDGSIVGKSVSGVEAQALIQRSDDVYTLETDIIFQESDGFVIERNGVVLDLNGHEITFEEITAEPGPLIGVTVTGAPARRLNNITVKNCRNLSGFQSGFYLRDSDNIVIFNNTASYNDIGIYTQDCSNVTLERNILRSNIEEGIYIWHSSNHTVVGNRVSKHIVGILIFDSDNNTVSSNTVLNNTRGIALRRSMDNTIKDNTVSNNTEPGVPHGGICITDNSFNNNITGNKATSNNGAGIYLEDSNKTYVTNNNVTKNFGNGIQLQGSCQNTLRGNTASNNTVGINLTDNSNENDVLANTLTLNSRAGISLHSSASNTIDGNALSNNLDGVLLRSCNDNTICENRILNSDGHGIRLREHSGDIKKNTITGNFMFNNSLGISLANSSDNTVKRNDIMCSLRNGVELGDSSGNKVFGNYIQKSGQFGIFLLNSDDNTIRSNTVMTSNSSGINLTDSSGNRIYYNNFIENGPPQVEGNTMAENIWEDRDLVTNHTCPVCDEKDRRKGNYWSDYTGVDDGSSTQAHNCPCDGIGDTPYLDLDDYPLMAPWIPIDGDLDLNGVVDIYDVVLLTINFGSTT